MCVLSSDNVAQWQGESDGTFETKRILTVLFLLHDRVRTLSRQAPWLNPLFVKFHALFRYDRQATPTLPISGTMPGLSAFPSPGRRCFMELRLLPRRLAACLKKPMSGSLKYLRWEGTPMASSPLAAP